ncbi:MAG: hypothetical protein IKG97_08815 [Lachnospiraceae bacterium]|nr:hypothetical protein [Lachnospiraceae bacterium]
MTNRKTEFDRIKVGEFVYTSAGYGYVLAIDTKGMDHLVDSILKSTMKGEMRTRLLGIAANADLSREERTQPVLIDSNDEISILSDTDLVLSGYVLSEEEMAACSLSQASEHMDRSLELYSRIYGAQSEEYGVLKKMADALYNDYSRSLDLIGARPNESFFDYMTRVAGAEARKKIAGEGEKDLLKHELIRLADGFSYVYEYDRLGPKHFLQELEHRTDRTEEEKQAIRRIIRDLDPRPDEEKLPVLITGDMDPFIGLRVPLMGTGYVLSDDECEAYDLGALVDIQKSALEMTSYLYGPDSEEAEAQRKTLTSVLGDFGGMMKAVGVGNAETLTDYFARKVKEIQA